MKHILFSILFLSCFLSKAQFVIEKPETKDTAYTIPMITASYAHQWSASDMANRFGHNNNLGGSFMVKTSKNWLYGFKGNFLWGGNVNDHSVLSNLKNGDGEVIDNEGRLTHVNLGQRGSSFFLFGGKMINKLAPNKNSGFIFYGGLGMLQHKVSIKFQDDVSSLTDEHKKGYDRFSMGYAVNGFAGYLFLSKNRLLNFFGGFDYTYGVTKSWRGYNYDTQETDTKSYTNILYGARIGWIIRLNKRQTSDYYYN
jgi:hypothetical protein